MRSGTSQRTEDDPRDLASKGKDTDLEDGQDYGGHGRHAIIVDRNQNGVRRSK